MAGFWADGFWQTGFWADGFWAEGEGSPDVLEITTTSLPNGVVGVSYSQSVVADGGVEPYAFAVTAGALPDGLSLNASSGAITGTPTVADTFTFTVTVTDDESETDGQAFEVTISEVAAGGGGVFVSGVIRGGGWRF